YHAPTLIHTARPIHELSSLTTASALALHAVSRSLFRAIPINLSQCTLYPGSRRLQCSGHPHSTTISPLLSVTHTATAIKGSAHPGAPIACITACRTGSGRSPVTETAEQRIPALSLLMFFVQ